MSNQFLTNYSEITFLDKIKDNLRKCKSFSFSVSFIKKAGLVLLIKDIEAAVARGANGRIITSTYQNFTDIESLKSFFAIQNKFSNFKCHLDYECFNDNGYSTLGYHSKGYLFKFEDNYEVIVGSSNITRYALLKNIEWDVVVKETIPGLFVQAMAEFEDKWKQTYLLNSDIINLYSTKLNFAIERWDMDYDFTRSNIKPNFMQRKALKELNRYRAMGEAKALIVSAAGSGKTYLAAFDALNFNPKKLLYIVHEGSILKKSLETFQDVFGSSVSFGIFSGESKEYDTNFIFATNITMCKSLELFVKDEFDYIIIDECHHAIAETYKKIITYFKLWQSYRMDQVQLKLLKNPGYTAVGTYYYDDYLVIFASLKKDLPEADKLNYKDIFLQSNVFQWESMTNLPISDFEKLKNSSYAHLFVRKVSTENGIVLPFTYVGKGKLTNGRKTETGNGTYLFDIPMENELPDYLQYDFGVTK